MDATNNCQQDLLNDICESEESSKHYRKSVHIVDTSALHCKNACGFFGNREWDGYCSQCYKKKRQQTSNDSEAMIMTTSSINKAANKSFIEDDYRTSAVNSNDLPIISTYCETDVSRSVNQTNAVHHSVSSLSMFENNHKISNSPIQQQTQAHQSSRSSSYRKGLLPEMLTRAQSATALTTPTNLNVLPGVLPFRRFEEKKRQQQTDRKFPSFFGRASFREQRSASTTTPPNSSPSNSSHSSNIVDGTNNRVLQMINSTLEKPLMYGVQYTEEMLSKLSGDHESDLQIHVNKTADKAIRMIQSGASIEQLTDIVSDFYEMMQNRFSTNPLYKGFSDKMDYLLDKIEQLLMERLYDPLFARVLNDEEERDLQLQKKIRSLNWVLSSHLHIDLNLLNPKVKSLLEDAISKIVELDTKQIPYEKLQCVVKCSYTIFEMLRANHFSKQTSSSSSSSLAFQDKTYSADDLLSALVFVIIKANPPLLQTNIKFITRFSPQSRLISGEAGYYYTNLCCATVFLENVCGNALNMSEEHFQSYMNGESLPPGHYRETFLCDAVQMLDSNLTSLNDAKDRCAMLESEIQLFDDRFEEYSGEWRKKCLNELELTNLSIIGASNYTIFNQEIQPDLLPTYFRSIYSKQAERKNVTTNGILIDIDDSQENDLNQKSDSSLADPVFNEICDNLKGLTLCPDEVVQDKGGDQIDTKKDI